MYHHRNGEGMKMESMIAAVTRNMIQYFGGDNRRINHALKVHSLAKTIAQLEQMPPEELQVLETAAILHDIGIKEAERQYNSTAGNYQELLGPPIARELLAEFNWDEPFLNRVCFLIGNHHSYSKIDHLDFQILVEADFLVNINEDRMLVPQIESIRDKYFKTRTGQEFLRMMFLSGR
jgi:HD superfamily phosphodiesterase